MYLDDYASFCDKALVYQRAALDTLLKQSGVPDVVFGQINAIVKGQHTIRTAKGDSVDISHVLIALPEAVGKFFDGGGKKFDGALFAGCVRRVANRKPEPTPADQRASEEQLRRAHPQLVDDRPRTPEEQREGRERVRLAMHAFYLQAGNSERARAYETPERGEVAA